jgi:hypothetical protein
MTGEELSKAILKYAKEIAPEATVIVFATTPVDGDDDESLAVMNASPYDLTTVVHMATDWLLEDMEVLLDKVDGAARSPTPAEQPS